MSLPATSQAPAAESAALSAPPCVDGHDAAQWFNQEVHPHGGQLKAWLRSRFPAVRDVDDVVQESYLRIWKARASHPIESVKSFLFTIARHLALDNLRQGKKIPLETGSDSAVLRVLDTAPDAAQALFTQETIDYLVEALACIPARYRNVIILHNLQGLSARDTGARLGLTEATVYKYACIGLDRCGEYLRAKGINSFYR